MWIIETPAGARLAMYSAPPKPKVDISKAGTFHGSGEDVALALEAFYNRCRERSRVKRLKEKVENRKINGIFSVKDNDR